jgi:hypothetical protein
MMHPICCASHERESILKGGSVLSHELQEASATDSGNPQSKSRGPGRKTAYFWGAASGVALALFAPMLRPAARFAVKGGIRVGRYTRKLASNVKEEFEDIAMEAQAEIDREEEIENGNGNKA